MSTCHQPGACFSSHGNGGLSAHVECMPLVLSKGWGSADLEDVKLLHPSNWIFCIACVGQMGVGPLAEGVGGLGCGCAHRQRAHPVRAMGSWTPARQQVRHAPLPKQYFGQLL